MVLFLLAGAALFALSRLAANDAERDDRRIVIDAALVAHLAALHRAQFGIDPDDATRERLISDHVRDEVLYREALARGLERDDDIVRRRLIQKLEYVLASDAELALPTAATLHAYYAAHRSDYLSPGRVTFDQRYFSTDRPDAAGRAAAALTVAQGTGDVGGDPLPLAARYEAVTRVQARQVFGDSPFVAALFTAPPGTWTGPIASGYGLHLLRVTARTEDAPRPFAEVEADVRDAWLRAAREQAVNRAVAALIARHRTERRDR
ncbi:MAG: peptidyl-prolyl cis-trans isomerase [Gammaproteobacteria bacterium]|nr:peptidyl-prolyl cis-trans isomerase [Gammaproteobacteria bacterium]